MRPEKRNVMQKWRHREDCEIVRPDSTYDVRIDGCAVVMDCDGERVFSVPESWTDAQIWACLEIANRAYATGKDAGQLGKAHEIAKALYLTR